MTHVHGGFDMDGEITILDSILLSIKQITGLERDDEDFLHSMLT